MKFLTIPYIFINTKFGMSLKKGKIIVHDLLLLVLKKTESKTSRGGPKLQCLGGRL